MSWRQPETLDLTPFVATAVLGRGGMATVYRAHHRDRPDQDVALKVLHAGQGTVARLRREGVLQAGLSHPNVLAVHDVVELPAGPALVLEHVDGPTLADWLRRDLPLDVVDILARGILAGVGAAHAAGIVHRDLKPGNVLLAPGVNGLVPKVGDFGLARSGQPVDSVRTATGLVVGTPRFMAPEQLRGIGTSAASDVFALGALLYELLTGRPCFPQVDPVALMAHITAGTFESLDRSNVPAAWPAAIARALRVAPADRPADALALLDAWGVRDAEGAVWAPALMRRARRLYRPEPLLRLPVFDDAFVGRVELIDEILASARPVTTVVGVGGVGKTRLAVELARRDAPRFPGGVWFCDLTDARSIAGVHHAVAGTLSVPLGADPEGQLGAALRGRGRVLVVLDNFEQVAEHAEATVGRWMRQAPQARFLVTSRVPLALPDEQVVRVGSLAVETSLDLFEARARRALPAFRLDDDNRAHARAIVESLGGLPLAIEIVAARVRTPTLERLRTKLAGRLQGLSRRGTADAAHRQTLAATFDWSWDLLTGTERSALAQLGVFEGGCTVEAATEVLRVDGPLSDALDALHAQSLVQRRGERLSLLPPVAEYARSRLHGRGVPQLDPREVEDRHMATFATFGDPPQLARMQRDSQLFARRASDLDNLLAAARRAGERRNTQCGVGATLAACAVFSRRGPRSSAVDAARRALELPDLSPMQDAWLRIALGVAVFATDLEEAEACATAVRDDPLVPSTSQVHASATLLLGRCGFERGQTDVAGEIFGAALVAIEDNGHATLRSTCLLRLAEVADRGGDLARAATLRLEAIDDAHRREDGRHEAAACTDLGNQRLAAARFDEAQALYLHGLSLFRESGDLGGQGTVTLCMATLARDQGRMTEAVPLFEEAIRLARRVGGRRLEATAMSNLGNLYWREGKQERARGLLQDSLVLHRELGSRVWEGFVLSTMGNTLHELGDPRGALAEHLQALVVFEEVGQEHYIGLAHGNSAHLNRVIGDLEASKRHIDRALEIFGRLDNDVAMGAALNLRGRWAVRMGDGDQAWVDLMAGLALHRAAGDHGHLTGNLQATAAEALVLGRSPDAEGFAREGLALLDGGGGAAAQADLAATLGIACLRQGRAEEGRGHIEQASAVLDDLRDPTSRVSVACSVAELAAHDGDLERAGQFHARATVVVESLELLPGSELAQRVADLSERLGR